MKATQGQQYLHLFCQHEHDFALCPSCGKISSSRYDHKSRCVRHLDIFGRRCFLHFDLRRFECSDCGKPFTERFAWIDVKRRQTIAFEKYIFQRVEKTPRKHVALEEALSESTVLDIFKRMAKAHIDKRGCHANDAVRTLGVDEISLRKGHKHYVLVLTDIERRHVVAVLKDRRKRTLIRWLEALPESQRRGIKRVSMDMWKPYRAAAREKLPHAEIIADRFHVMKQLNHQMNLIRRVCQRKAAGEMIELLKGSRWLFLKNREDLTPEDEKKLCRILQACDELRRAYLLKEQFRIICNKIRNKDKAERFLKSWVSLALATGSRYLKKFVNTLRNWWSEFLNYFDERITQGFVEGTNRAIRGIINRAFGYRNFEYFRYQVLIECGFP